MSGFKIVDIHIVGEGADVIFQDDNATELFTGKSFRRMPNGKLALAHQPYGLGSAAERAFGADYKNARHVVDDPRDFRKEAFMPSKARIVWTKKVKALAP